MRRKLLAEIVNTGALRVQGSDGDGWKSELTRMQSIYDEVRGIVNDDQFTSIIPRPAMYSPRRGTFSPAGTVAKCLNTGRELVAYIDTLLQLYITPKTEQLSQEAELSTKVFIGHGRDAVVRGKVKDFIVDRCGFDAIILQEQPSTGMTVIEKLEKYGRQADYAVLILTGDDVLQDGEVHARQNVIQELGWFQGVVGRRRTAILLQEGVELGSNVGGVVYLPFPDQRVETTFEDLRKEFEEAGLLAGRN